MNARRGGKHEVVIGLEPVTRSDEDAAGLVHQGDVVLGHDGLADGVAQLLQIVVRRAIDHDQVYRESTPSPVPMGGEQFTQRGEAVH